MEAKTLRPAYLVYPGLYPLLMMNYWVRRSQTPIVAILLSDFDMKYKGHYLPLWKVVLGVWQECGFLYMVYMLFISKFGVPGVRFWNFFRRLVGKEIKIKTYDEIAREKGIPIFRTKDFNDEATRLFLKNVQANLVVSAYNNQILKRRLYNFPEYKSVNIHPALLPNFRGLDGPFEALYYGVKDAGVTIHYVDGKIDTGRILVQEPVRIRRTDTLFSLSVRCWMHGAKILEKVFQMVRDDAVVPRKQNPRDIRYPYESFPKKAKVKEFLKRRKIFTWQDLKGIFRD